MQTLKLEKKSEDLIEQMCEVDRDLIKKALDSIDRFCTYMGITDF